MNIPRRIEVLGLGGAKALQRAQDAATSAAAAVTTAAAKATEAVAAALEAKGYRDQAGTIAGLPTEAAAQAYNLENDPDVKAVLSASYAPTAKTTGTGSPQVQLGPKLRTKSAGTNPVTALQNNDGTHATRVYVVPNGSTTSGVGGVLKIFADDYTADQANYRDLGLYFSQDQASPNHPTGDTGTRGDGCFYINAKSSGTKAGVVPDIVLSMQDGTGVIARGASPIVGGQSKYTFVVGPGKPEHATKRALVLEVQGDIGFDGAGDRSIYWETTGGTSSNVLTFERTAANGNLRLKLGGAQRALLTGSGDLILGDQSADMNTASTVGFLHVRSMSGTPTGAPTLHAGAVPLVVDRTGSKLWAHIGGSWKSVTFA